MWASAQEPHFQTSILVTFTKLVEVNDAVKEATSDRALTQSMEQALEDQSQPLQPQSAPVIQLSIDPSQPAHVYLQEDALELWLALLKRSSALSTEMLGLLPMLVALIASATDVLPRCLSILESYLLLDAVSVLHVSPVLSRSSSEGDRSIVCCF